MYNLIQYASGPIKIYNLPIHLYYSIFNYAETTRSDSDYYVGNTVRELCLTRSADFILDTAELNLLIHHLCTS